MKSQEIRGRPGKVREFFDQRLTEVRANKIKLIEAEILLNGQGKSGNTKIVDSGKVKKFRESKSEETIGTRAHVDLIGSAHRPHKKCPLLARYGLAWPRRPSSCIM